MQQTFYDFSAFELLKDKKPLLVCDDAFDSFGIEFPCEVTRFSDFTSNPDYEDIKSGVKVLRKNKCDFIVAIGGGSSIDTAKSIKYYNHINLPLMAVPTTSGTGSEATHFAVIYRNGKKQSVADERLLPEYVILQADTLKTLPLYQKKCTMLDALCQAIESWWSKKATQESILYSQKAIYLILSNMESYLHNDNDGNTKMLVAANLAGKAINITTTTAPHAMSYKLTSLYGLPHGHAVAICLPKVWRYMENFDYIAKALGTEHYEDAVSLFEEMLLELEILPPQNVNEDDLDILTNSVNRQRLSNNPVRLNKSTIKKLYKEILETEYGGEN
ncbi:MAG: phosphonoacetaldehyde reductase [Saccharofermentanales bacterium]|jgi:alcohol dehydrogenase class IV